MKERTKEQPGSRRSEWLFTYTVGVVLKGARVRLAHHQDRIKWWNRERDKMVKLVKKGTISVKQYAVTGGKRSQVAVESKHAARLTECEQKIDAHRAKEREFRQWVAVLDSQSSGELIDLSMDDALYFGVARNEPEE